MTRDEAWAALRAAYPGKTHSLNISIDDWDMSHTEPFTWFAVSIQPGPDGSACWQTSNKKSLAEAVEEAVKVAAKPPPVPGEVEAYFKATEPVPELAPEQTRRFEAALQAAAGDGFAAPADPAWPTHDENGNKPPAPPEGEKVFENQVPRVA